MKEALEARWDGLKAVLGYGQVQKLSPRQEARLIRHLSLMLNNGIPIMEALTILKQNSEESAAWVAERISAALYQGYPLSQAFRRVGSQLSPICPPLVEAGERSGSLVRVLELCADWSELTADLRSRTLTVLYYPLFVLLINLVLAALMLSYIFPVFLPLFAGETLPLLTRFFLALSQLAGSKLAWLLLLAVGLEAVWYLGQLDQRDRLYRAALFFPVLSGMIRNAARTRFCAVLSITSRSGLPLMDALKLAARASGDPDMVALDASLQEEVRAGVSPQEHFLAHSEVYGAPLSHAMALSQETGRTDFIFEHMTKLYQTETETEIQIFQSLIEPLLIGVVSATTGILLLAIYLPLGKFLQTLVA